MRRPSLTGYPSFQSTLPTRGATYIGLNRSSQQPNAGSGYEPDSNSIQILPHLSPAKSVIVLTKYYQYCTNNYSGFRADSVEQPSFGVTSFTSAEGIFLKGGTT